MALINRYESCFGITLYKWGQYRAEIWFIPRNYSIVPHRHPSEDVELMFIFGRTEFFRQSIRTWKIESLATTWKCFGQCFSVMNYHYHSFKTTNWPLVFINFQKFLTGCKPKSAASDFITKD